MILDALAAKPFAWARVISAVAVGQVAFFLAFHQFLLKSVAYPFILGELGRFGQGNLWEPELLTVKIEEKRKIAPDFDRMKGCLGLQ
jgi:hypothetical protein